MRSPSDEIETSVTDTQKYVRLRIGDGAIGIAVDLRPDQARWLAGLLNSSADRVVAAMGPAPEIGPETAGPGTA